MANQYDAPGVYVEYLPSTGGLIQGVGTSTALFVAPCPGAPAGYDTAVPVGNFSRFLDNFATDDPGGDFLCHAARGFFENGGSRLYVVATKDANGVIGDQQKRTGLWAARGIDEPAILAIPGVTDLAAQKAAINFCETRRDLFAVLDAPADVPSIDDLTKGGRITAQPQPDEGDAEDGGKTRRAGRGGGGLNPGPSEQGFGSFNFPWITVTDHKTKAPVTCPPSGHIAGLYARVDAERGVHKAPANEPLRGVLNLRHKVDDAERGMLNRHGVNVILSTTRRGIRLFGARTIADQNSSDWRYVNVKRFLIFIEETLNQALLDSVFESNDRFLQAALKMRISSFLTQQWRAGALVGATPDKAFFVKCDSENNPPDEVALGKLCADVGLAIVRPAEFVIVRLSQSVGESAASAEA